MRIIDPKLGKLYKTYIKKRLNERMYASERDLKYFLEKTTRHPIDNNTFISVIEELAEEKFLRKCDGCSTFFVIY